jgi:DNA-binding MarR family transcriptional regulator
MTSSVNGGRVDQLVSDWERERPDVDASAMAIVGRLWLLSRSLDKELGELLAPHGLTPSEFDLLAVLRRSGRPGGHRVSDLGGRSLVTSGTMTNRIDRLEAKGLVKRISDPEDRRAILVALTPAGREAIDLVVPERIGSADQRISRLSQRDRGELVRLLDRLL